MPVSVDGLRGRRCRSRRSSRSAPCGRRAQRLRACASLRRARASSRALESRARAGRRWSDVAPKRVASGRRRRRGGRGAAEPLVGRELLLRRRERRLVGRQGLLAPSVSCSFAELRLEAFCARCDGGAAGLRRRQRRLGRLQVRALATRASPCAWVASIRASTWPLRDAVADRDRERRQRAARRERRRCGRRPARRCPRPTRSTAPSPRDDGDGARDAAR